MNPLKNIDKSKFSDDKFIKRIEKPWGYEIHFTSENLPYMGKILHVNLGKRLSLQVHDQKMESWYLLSGKARMVREDQDGNLNEVEMEANIGYTNQIGQIHRLIGGDEAADILEVSTPEIGNTYRLEDDYQRSTETEELRKEKNRGWKN